MSEHVFAAVVMAICFVLLALVRPRAGCSGDCAACDGICERGEGDAQA
jgi:hypothetical protein